jgi:aminoglycoside phosphotransferase (APT) family kinase protein
MYAKCVGLWRISTLPIVPDHIRSIDGAVPAFGLLLGDDARLVLEAAIKPTGGHVEDVTVRQVLYRPGRIVTVEYRVRVGWRDRAATAETLIATSGGELPPGTAVIDAAGFEVAVWHYPNDPFLPGLASIGTVAGARAALEAVGAGSRTVRLRRRSYRPGRRAVVEIVTPEARMYAKVVRPGRVASLQAIHRSMLGRAPVPRSLGWSRDSGVVLLEALPGRTVRSLLEKRRRWLPEAKELISLLDALPDPDESGHAVPASPRRRAERHADLLYAVAPSLDSRIRKLVDRLPDVGHGDVRSIHGDFHSSQVLSHDRRITGLIDVDTLRYGTRSEDLGRFLAHIGALRVGGKVGSGAVQYATHLRSQFDSATSPVAIRDEAIAALIGYATGPFRVQEPSWTRGIERRIELAERWADGTA